jgi:hypothetical protein
MELRGNSKFSSQNKVKRPPEDGTSSGCGWRRQPPDMEGSYECIEQAVMDSRQGVLLLHGVRRGLKTPHRKIQYIMKCCAGLQTWTDYFEKMQEKENGLDIWNL